MVTNLDIMDGYRQHPSLLQLAFSPTRVFLFAAAWYFGLLAFGVRLFGTWRDLSLGVVCFCLGGISTMVAATRKGGRGSKAVSHLMSYLCSSILAAHVVLSFFFVYPIGTFRANGLVFVVVRESHDGPPIGLAHGWTRKLCITCAEWVTLDLKPQTFVFEIPIADGNGASVEVVAQPNPDNATLARILVSGDALQRRIDMQTKAKMLSCAYRYTETNSPVAGQSFPTPHQPIPTSCASELPPGMHLRNATLRVLSIRTGLSPSRHEGKPDGAKANHTPLGEFEWLLAKYENFRQRLSRAAEIAAAVDEPHRWEKPAGWRQADQWADEAADISYQSDQESYQGGVALGFAMLNSPNAVEVGMRPMGGDRC